MIRDWLVVTGILAMLTGCSPSKWSPPSGEDTSATGISISGAAVTGVVGGSGQSTRLVSGIKDLEMSVGVELGGN